MTWEAAMDARRPRLLDLFCCEGGAGMGYHRAGFEVVGVDKEAQPNYPFEFVQGDAIEYLEEHGHLFDAVHASPPCQGYTQITRHKERQAEWPKLIAPVRDELVTLGRPYVIENVVGARDEMRETFLLHGGMFGLGVDRPRLFETNFLVMVPRAPRKRGGIGVYGKLDGRRLWTRKDGSELRNPSSLEEAQEAMGMPWASWDGVREAIPPAYTEWIGSQLLASLVLESNV